jgi:hypothetical protein
MQPQVGNRNHAEHHGRFCTWELTIAALHRVSLSTVLAGRPLTMVLRTTDGSVLGVVSMIVAPANSLEGALLGLGADCLHAALL